MDDAAVKMHVKRTAELYDDYPFGDFCYGAKRDAHNRPLIDFLATLAPEARVCDIGCGTGYWLERAVALGAERERCCGVDLSASGLAALRAKGFRGIYGDILHLPLADGVSDVTICNGVIHHTPAPFEAFREVVRVTRPGGRVFLSVYVAWNPYFYLVHRATWPLRVLYWGGHKGILDGLWRLARLPVRAIARLTTGTSWDERTAKTVFMDHVVTPHAHVFTKAGIRRYAARCGCTIEGVRYTGDYMMLTAVIRV